jgi:hypothetical protein
MRFKVTIESDGEFSASMVKSVLMDALYNFSFKRRDAQEYVDTAYPEWSEEEKFEKCKEVENRVAIAKALHQGSKHVLPMDPDDMDD